MGEGSFDIAPTWTAIIALGVFLYVLVDGSGLGIGILWTFAPEDGPGPFVGAINLVGGGNGTFIIPGGVAVLAVFLVVFVMIIPAEPFR
jgi:cytochrome d ubiquinol oxidase subunit II